MRYLFLVSCLLCGVAIATPCFAQATAQESTATGGILPQVPSVSAAPASSAPLTIDVPSQPQSGGQAGAMDQVEAWIDEQRDELGLDSNSTAIGPSSGGAIAPPGLTSDNGLAQVDWGSGSVTALGIGDIRAGSYNPARENALATRKATLAARKQLQEAVLALSLDGSRVVGMELNSRQAGKVRGILQNSPIVKNVVAADPADPSSTERVEVTATALLRSSLAEAVIPGAETFLSRIPPSITLTVPVPYWVVDEEQLAYRNSMAELGAYTGVVVDARGFEALPALLPVLAAPDGKLAYGPFQVSRTCAVDRGMALYVNDDSALAVGSRVGGTPLQVRVLAVSGENKADLVISTEDAELVRLLFKNDFAAGTCPVAIVLDRPTPEEPELEP